MNEYKRLTEVKEINKYCSTVVCGEHCEDCYVGKLYERLAELEDKIENGTLIEFPRIDRYVDFCYGLEKFVVQWVVNGKVKSKTFWDEKKAKAKLKKLQEKGNDR